MLSDNKTLAQRPCKRTWKRFYTDKEKLEAVQLYLLTGNQRATAAALNLHKNTMNNWVSSQWFKDLSQQVRNEGHIALSNKLKTIASKALDVTLDRLENGEWIYNQKTGEMIRKPVQARDSAKIAASFLDSAEKVEKQSTKEVTENAAAGRLEQLAEAFKLFATKTTRVEVIDVIGVENAISEERKA